MKSSKQSVYVHQHDSGLPAYTKLLVHEDRRQVQDQRPAQTVEETAGDLGGEDGWAGEGATPPAARDDASGPKDDPDMQGGGTLINVRRYPRDAGMYEGVRFVNGKVIS
ncbi:hypothetical protein [Halotalea alkalilenta]|uniref:hypothetical protein n=1 Tax=Halotalea alkalilenta TaxID=376489 RepID=UPI000489D517|nr:hypothetical protein [Halotalea alkalilenta]